MSRSNPRIQAQQNILHQLLANKPKYEDFDQEALADWKRLGMGPNFYLYNGIEAFARVAEELLAKLNAEEEEWKAKKNGE